MVRLSALKLILSSLSMLLWDTWNERSYTFKKKIDVAEVERPEVWHSLENAEYRDALENLFSKTGKLVSLKRIFATTSQEEELNEVGAGAMSLIDGVRGVKGECYTLRSKTRYANIRR